MDKLKNKAFVGIYRIVITEDGNKYELEDSIVLKGSETFQLFTTQKNLDVLKINNKYHVDGEYNSNQIEIVPILQEAIKIDKILLINDESINQTVAFSITSNDKDYFFIRYSDEIQFTQKSEYEKMISHIKNAKIIQI